MPQNSVFDRDFSWPAGGMGQEALQRTLGGGGGIQNPVMGLLDPIMGGDMGLDPATLTHPTEGDWSQLYNELLEDPMGFMSLLMGQIPVNIGIEEREQFKTDPLRQLQQQHAIEQFNRAQGQNPYGDPWSGWGGMFGQNDAGENIGFGEAQARSLFGQLENPFNQEMMANFGAMAGMQGPAMSDVTAPLQQLLGGSPGSGMFQPSAGFAPTVPNIQPQTDFSGAPAGETPAFNIPEQLAWLETARRESGAASPQATGDPRINKTAGQVIPRFALGGRMRKPGVALVGEQGPELVGLNQGDMVYNNQQTQSMGAGGGQMPQGVSRPSNVAAGELPGGYTGGVANSQIAEMDAMRQQMIARGENPDAIMRQLMGGQPQGQQPIPNSGLQQAPPMTYSGGGMMSGGQYMDNSLIAALTAQGGQGQQQPTASFGPTPSEMQAQAPQPQVTQATGPGALSTNQPSLLSQVFQNPQSMGMDVQNQLYNRGKEGIDAESAAFLRAMQEQAGAGGQLDSGAFQRRMFDAGQARMGQLGNLRRDIGIEASRTNFGDLMGAANLQLGANMGMGQLGLQQNALAQNTYNQNFQNQLSALGLMQGVGVNAFQNQIDLWKQLENQGNTGIGFANPFAGDVSRGNPVNFPAEVTGGTGTTGAVDTTGGGAGGVNPWLQAGTEGLTNALRDWFAGRYGSK